MRLFRQYLTDCLGTCSIQFYVVFGKSCRVAACRSTACRKTLATRNGPPRSDGRAAVPDAAGRLCAIFTERARSTVLAALAVAALASALLAALPPVAASAAIPGGGPR